MAKRGGRKVFLGVQWDCGSWDKLPPLCDLIIDKVGKRPILWNFPAPPTDNPKRIKAWLQKAVGARLDTDLIAAMGYAGACHPILTLDEMEKELSWGIENPWGTGVSQLLDVRPDILMPRVADLLRADALKIYRGNGFKTLGIPCGRGVAWFARDGLECFTCSRVAALGPRGHRRGAPLSLVRRESDVLLMIDLSGFLTPEGLGEELERTVIPRLAPEGTPSPLTAPHPSPGDLSGLAVEMLDWSPFPDPVLRQVLTTSASTGKKKRRKNEEYREHLAGLSLNMAGAAAAAARDAKEAVNHDALPDGSRLVAQMLGEVELAGNGFDVKLAGGKFTGIMKAGHDLLPLRPARSYLRVDGKAWHFRTRNSFSFEGDGGTGLRETLTIDSLEEASLTIEYSFCEGSPMLEITADMRWPVLSPGTVVDEHAPLVIALRELGRSDEALVETETPDGSVSSLRAGDGRWLVMPAAFHRVNLPGGGTLSLRPGPSGTRGWNLASFRVVREGRRRLLEANPFGGWFPLSAAILSGRREKFSLLIGIEA